MCKKMEVISLFRRKCSSYRIYGINSYNNNDFSLKSKITLNVLTVAIFKKIETKKNKCRKELHV